MSLTRPSRHVAWVLVPWIITLGCGESDSGGDAVDVTVQDSGAAPSLDTSAQVDTQSDEPDGAPLPGTFGAPCSNNSDCDSNFCISGLKGKVCTRTCVEDCPTDFSCSPVKTGSDLVYVCLPAFGLLCDPCATNADCNDAGSVTNVCVSYGPNGSFCAAACDTATPCPDSHACQQVINPATGSVVNQCMPKSGVCSCSPKAISLQLSTKCEKKNETGSCAGVRVCEATGLSTCKAATPAPETCNGLDDDCDGLTDNLPADAMCENSNEHGVCKGTLKACVNGQPQCDAATPQPETCNGLDDDCDGVTDNTSQCDDGDPCTQDQCNTSGSCKHSAIEGLPCDDGDGCTAPDACAGGKCQPGAQKSCDDNNPCTKDSCAPLTGCVHNPTDGLCADDGDPCTQDLCQGGACAHPPSKAGGPCVDDGNPCTDDFCQGGSCQHPPAAFAVKCTDDGDPCTADVCDKGGCTHQPLGTDALCLEDGDPCTQDVCKGGKCTHPPAVDGAACKDDGKPCTVDSCAKGQCTHVTKSGEPCPDDGNLCTDDVCGSGGLCTHPAKVNQPCEDDGNPCTQDKCQNKLCKHPYSKANCTDNDPCTVTDYCDFGKCKGINMLKCDDGNPCTQDLCATGVGCKHNKLNGVGCTDGNACTSGDKCVNGQCKGQGNNKCDDGNPCTDDTCTSGGGCANKPNSMGCTDDGNPCTQDVCAGGACTHPGSQEGKACGGGSDPCTSGVCSAGVCKQTTNDNVCDDGDACTSNDKCAGGVCKGTAFKSCDDGNPCTQDKCDATGKCIHVPQGQASCIAKSSECPIGICQGGKCVSQPGVVCEAKYKADLCSTVKVAGTCTGSGDCVASSVPPAYTCPGCNGICVKCLIFQFCIPLF